MARTRHRNRIPLGDVPKREHNTRLVLRDIQPWQRSNELILSGYRPASFSDEESLWSIFAIHNQTVNIWLHILGTCLFLTTLSYHTTAPAIRSTYPEDDRLILNLYQLSLLASSTLSTVHHIFTDHSPQMHHDCAALHDLGLVLAAWGTGISTTYLAFYCHATLRTAYLALLTLVALAYTGTLTRHPKFRRAAYRPTRLLLHALLGASLFAPVVHGVALFGYDRLQHTTGLSSFLALVLLACAGAAVHAARVPERWYPETFDLVGQSRHWTHVLVLAGAVVRLYGLLNAVERRRMDTAQYGLCSRSW